MPCLVKMLKKPKLENAILLEGLPGIGFVANIAALHLIKELNAKKFAEIISSSFQDFVISSDEGGFRPPVNELYYYDGSKGGKSCIILYGNTQALTGRGQYELCGRILDIAVESGCNFVVTMGGLKRGGVIKKPELYCAATDEEILEKILKFDVGILSGRIYGAAGILLGLAKLRGLKGFCVLAETLGFYPDATAAKEVLNFLSKIFEWKIDLKKLEAAAKATIEILKSFGLLNEEKKTQTFKGLI